MYVWEYFAAEWPTLTDDQKVLYQRIWLAARRDYAEVVIPLWAQSIVDDVDHKTENPVLD